MKHVLNTENAPKALGPYSQGIKAGDLIFLSGQLGLDPKTNDFASGGVAEQTRQALTNLKHVIESAGSRIENVVKTTVFLNDMNDFQAMNAVYGEFFKSEPPARSTVQVAALPKGGMVEIEAIVKVE
ncbi:MAG: RidA family protein [Anaerolineaceae bacterium]|nr:RidA family protein [Anaerolineaceae bacterium]